MSKLTRSEAARLNGAKSRGPVTPEGKARSSRNSTKHGLCARTLSGESSAKLEELREMYFERFRPATDYQAQLVEELVSIRWRLRRLPDIETALIDHEMDRQSQGIDKTYSDIDDVTRLALAFEKLATGSSGAMHLILRYEAGLRRAYEKIVRALERDRNLPNEPNAPERSEEVPNEPDAPHCKLYSDVSVNTKMGGSNAGHEPAGALHPCLSGKTGSADHIDGDSWISD